MYCSSRSLPPSKNYKHKLTGGREKNGRITSKDKIPRNRKTGEDLQNINKRRKEICALRSSQILLMISKIAPNLKISPRSRALFLFRFLCDYFMFSFVLNCRKIARNSNGKFFARDTIQAKDIDVMVHFYHHMFLADKTFQKIKLAKSGITRVLQRNVEYNRKTVLGKDDVYKALKLVIINLVRRVLRVIIASITQREGVTMSRPDVIAGFRYVANWKLLLSQSNAKIYGKGDVQVMNYAKELEKMFYDENYFAGRKNTTDDDKYADDDDFGSQTSEYNDGDDENMDADADEDDD